MLVIKIAVLCFYLLNLIESYIFTIEKCETGNKLAIIEKCEVKSNRMTIIMTNTKPVVKADVSIILFKIESSKRRQLFKSQKINFCSALDKETAKGNPMIKVTLGALKDSLTKLKCPWNGIKMENFTIERKFVEFFPAGEYRAYTDIDLYAETECFTVTLEKYSTKQKLVNLEKFEIKDNKVSMNATTFKPVVKIDIDIVLYKIEKNGEKHHIFKTPKFDFCAAVKNASNKKGNHLLKIFLAMGKNFLYKMKCPWTAFSFEKETLDRKTLNIFSNGKYYAIIKMELFSEDEDKDLLSANLLFDLN